VTPEEVKQRCAEIRRRLEADKQEDDYRDAHAYVGYARPLEDTEAAHWTCLRDPETGGLRAPR
jgi:hypothetical protein